MSTSTSDQSPTQKLQDNLPATEQLDPAAPRMPFATNYILTRAEEDALVNDTIAGVEAMSKRMGRDDVVEGEGGEGGGRQGKGGEGRSVRKRDGHGESHLAKRARWTSRYENDVSDRAEKDTIFEHSNLTASLSQRICRQMSARGINYFVGQPDDTDWFTTEAVGEEDQTLSDKIKKHSRWKVKQCGTKKAIANAIEWAFVRGETVVKSTHQQRFQVYKRKATILCKTTEGDPLLDANGDFIVQGDVFVPELRSQNAEVGSGAPAQPQAASPDPANGGSDSDSQSQQAEPLATDATSENQQAEQEQTDVINNGGPQMVPTGAQVLKRDGVTPLPAVPIWQEQVIARKLVTFEGPDTSVVYYKDFLYPISAPDLQTAPMICHLYDMELMAIAQMFAGQFEEGDQGLADFAAAVEHLRAMAIATPAPKAAKSKARKEKKEAEDEGLPGTAVSQFAEVWRTYSKDGNGMNDEILIIIDRKNKTPVYYEYAANVTVRGLRPFRVIRPMAVDGRLYGMGAMEYLETEQEPLDLMVNRHNFATSKSGRVTLWRPYNTIEGDGNTSLSLNDGGTYTPKPGKEAKDVLEYVELPNNAEMYEFMLNLYMQLMQTKSGVLNSADQEMSGLPSNKLATGINEIKESGQELFALTLMELFPGVEGLIDDVIDLIYANMNKPEVFSYFNGDASEIMSLTPEEVRDLSLKVTLSLTRTQQAKAVETGQVAQALIQWFYGLPPELQERVAIYARNQLKAIGVAQSDKIIEPMPPQNAGPMQKIAESINYKDAPPSIKRQMESQAGMQPATEEETAIETKAFGNAGKGDSQSQSSQKPGDANTGPAV